MHPTSRPQPQPLPKAVSETRVPAEKAPIPKRWEEAVRRQEEIAQSTLHKPKAEATYSTTTETPETQVLSKKKRRQKKKNGEG